MEWAKYLAGKPIWSGGKDRLTEELARSDPEVGPSHPHFASRDKLKRRRSMYYGSTAYVYAIVVDDIVRYIGKGRGSRLLTHAINAKRDAVKSSIRIDRLTPRMHRNLVKAVRAGSHIAELIITSGLSDTEAYCHEADIIADFHRGKTGQLWNTIDERFMDYRLLPLEWDNPENPLYKLRRPLAASAVGLPETQRRGSERSARISRRRVSEIQRQQAPAGHAILDDSAEKLVTDHAAL